MCADQDIRVTLLEHVAILRDGHTSIQAYVQACVVEPTRDQNQHPNHERCTSKETASSDLHLSRHVQCRFPSEHKEKTKRNRFNGTVLPTVNPRTAPRPS